MTDMNMVPAEDREVTEEEFLASYSMKDFPSVAVTVDLLIFTIRDGSLSLLLIKRGGHPEKGKWALPGGFVNTTESLDEAAARELFEETGINVGGHLEQLKTYGSPDRDKRGFVVTTAYVALIPEVNSPVAGDDAAEAHFFPVDDVLDDDFNLAFDHREIITDGLERVRAKIEYSPLATKFLRESEFTITELRRIYEIVWGYRLTPQNFRRKMLSVAGLLEPVPGQQKVDGRGRPSDLYTAGEATEIYPPIQRAHMSD